VGFLSTVVNLVEKAVEKKDEMTAKAYDSYDKFYNIHKHKSKEELEKIFRDTRRSSIERHAAHDLYEEKE
jgi:hypothetical protein